MRYFSLILIIASVQLCAQRPLVPYNYKGLWGFADTSGNIVVKPFSKYQLSPLNWGLSRVSAGENKKGIVDTNANFVLPLEFYECKFNNIGIEAVKRHYYQAKDGIYKELWYYLYNKKGIPIPIGPALYIELLADTNFITTRWGDSTFFYHVSWQNAKSKLLFRFKTNTTVLWQYKQENSSSLHYIMNYGPLGKTEFYWPDGRIITDEEIAELMINSSRANDSLRRSQELYTSYENLIVGKKGKYRLRSGKSSKVFDKITPVYVQDGFKPDFKLMMAKKGKVWSIIDTFGNEKGKITCDYLSPINGNGNNLFTGLFLVKKSVKWGLCDTAGRFFLELKYDEIEPESNYVYMDNKICLAGILRVKLKGKFGLADSLGNILLGPVYDLIEMKYLPRNYRILLCKKEGKYTIYNAAEKQFIGNEFDSVIYVIKGYFIVRKGNLWGVINSIGDIVIDFQIEEFPRDEVEIIAAGNDICLLGGINGEKYLFSNIRNYKKVKILDGSSWKAEWPTWLNLGDNYLRILKTRSHIVIMSEKNKNGYETREHVNIAGMEYYFYKLSEIVEGYIREDGKVFFQK